MSLTAAVGRPRTLRRKAMSGGAPLLLRIATLAAITASLVTGGVRDSSAATDVGSSGPPFSSQSPGGYFRGPGKDRVIVFVNGIFGDAVSTWKNDGGAYWPTML